MNNESKYLQAVMVVKIGKRDNGTVETLDLAKDAHLLISGHNSSVLMMQADILLQLVKYNTPEQIRFVAINPVGSDYKAFQSLSLNYFAGLPGFSEERVISDATVARASIRSLVAEMDRRYQEIHDAKAHTIVEYNTLSANRLPNIVAFVHYYDCYGPQFEKDLLSLAQKARAVGIHLIISPSKMSTEAVTGMIKANFPIRIAFHANRITESRAIIDSEGAEKLAGKGQFLLLNVVGITRLQAFYVSEDDQPQYGQDNMGERYMLPEVDQEIVIDSLLENILRYTIEREHISAPVLQRKFGIGFYRAASALEDLENLGVIEPWSGSNPRKVLITSKQLGAVMNNMTNK